MRAYSLPLLATAIALMGCESNGKFIECPEAASLNVNRADEQAAQAFKEGDKRLLELGGLAPSVPGVAKPYELPAEINLRMLAGTGDDSSEDCEAIRPNTEAYAERYNRRMLALLKVVGR